MDNYSGHPRPLIYGKKSRFKNRQWYDTLGSVHSGCPGSLWRPIQLGRESWKKMRWCQQRMADHSRCGTCPSIPISQSPRAHLFERFWRTLSTCSRHCKVLLEGSGEIMRLSVLIIDYLRVPHHVFFPVATSRQEHNWVGEASQSLQIQAAMVHGEVRKNLGKAEMCFAK